jgi:transcriptional regulator with PAS, ATPase and Fis domain
MQFNILNYSVKSRGLCNPYLFNTLKRPLGNNSENLLPSDSGARPGDRVSLEKEEEEHIRRVLATTTSLQEAADILGIDQATLWRRRKKYGI